MKTKKTKISKTLLKVSRKAGRAITDFKMIEDGDRIMVAVSGGKDSLSLMHVLRHRQRINPIKFKLIAVHVDFELSDFDPKELVDYLKAEGFDYHVEMSDFLKGEKYEEIDCFWWSRNRRKALFQYAEREGYNKLALGHHLDDIVETIVLNQFYRGEIGAMKPNQTIFNGALTIIRPLAYVREEAMVQVAKEIAIDSMGQSKCAHDDTSNRMKIKAMIREFEQKTPGIAKNIFNSLSNIKSDYLLNTLE